MYKEQWSEQALLDFDNIITYLKNEWSDKVAENFIGKLEEVIDYLKTRPEIFQVIDERPEIRRVVITKHNSLYFKITGKIIYIVTIFDTRQDEEKLKF